MELEKICKLCKGDNIITSIEEVQTIDWQDIVEVEAKKCLTCGCICFELEDYEVTQFDGKDQTNSFDNATYIKSDYDIAIEKMK